jgi:hypothetical protein
VASPDTPILTSLARWTEELEIGRLRDGSLDFLPRSFDEDRGLCSFKAELIDGALVQDWSHRVAPRYTINSLLGLLAAGHPDADAMTDCFLERNVVSDPADLGLLALLHTERGDIEAAAAAVAAGRRAAVGPLDMQELAWLLWGASAATSAGVDGADAAAVSLLGRMLAAHVHPRTALPRHSLDRHRRSIVSFGSTVYYLRALHEASVALGDPRADECFDRGLASVVARQGEQGEWPWLIDVGRGVAFDRYPVFSVHQDSMALLFLLPALRRGEPVLPAIRRSVRWVHGANELGLRFYVEEPSFFAYRAIERDETLTKVRRYGRWLTRRRGGSIPPARLRVNRECRSYHLGWILYAWRGWL